MEKTLNQTIRDIFAYEYLVKPIFIGFFSLVHYGYCAPLMILKSYSYIRVIIDYCSDLSSYTSSFFFFFFFYGETYSTEEVFCKESYFHFS